MSFSDARLYRTQMGYTKWQVTGTKHLECGRTYAETKIRVIWYDSRFVVYVMWGYVLNSDDGFTH